MGAALALDEAGLAQLRDQVLEIGEGEVLALGHRAQRDGAVAGLAAELDHQSHSVLGSGGKEHRVKSYRFGRIGLEFWTTSRIESRNSA